MRVVVAPDSFKGSMSALVAANAIAAGVRDAFSDADIGIVPLADGGEGTVDALVAAVAGSVVRTCDVAGPLGDAVTAWYGLLGPSHTTAVVEMAAASGLTLVPPDRRDPMRASTFGTGELIRAALEQLHIAHLIIGLGGSATNDGGAGALAALGVRFLDARGNILASPITPLNLPAIASVDASAAFTTSANVIIACDVTNPLVGANGASAVFGPQKGATPGVVAVLDANLRGFASILESLAQQRSAGKSPPGEHLANRLGGGAAGGLAAGLMALFPEAIVQPGIDVVLDAAGFNEMIRTADLVITGEGKLDAQTLSGKTISGVLHRTSARHVRTIALAGPVDAGAVEALRARGLQSAHSLLDLAASIDDAMGRGPELLRELARHVVIGLI